MGIYYYLVNKTKNERVHYDSHVKRRTIELNSTVQKALIQYMFDNLGDELVFVSDSGCHDIDPFDYPEKDLKEDK